MADPPPIGVTAIPPRAETVNAIGVPADGFVPVWSATNGYASWGAQSGPTGATGGTGPTGPTGPTGSGGSQPVLSATVTLSSAQLLNLTVLGIALVPAPAAGEMVVPIISTARYIPATTGYSGPTTLKFSNTTDPNDPDEVNISDLDPAVLAGTTESFITTYFLTTPPAAASPQTATPLTLLNFSDPLTDGDGSLQITTIYTVIPAP